MVPESASSHAPLAPFDLVLHAGRVVCPATGLDGPGAVAIVGDRIAAAGPGVDGLAREQLRLPDALILPGLVDLHAHPARGESRYGVDPDVHLLPFGTTTVLAQGEAQPRDRALADADPPRHQPLPARRGDARREL
jgi:dihydroorotase